MRASLEVADIFRAAGPAYRMAHAGHLSLHQLKIMSAIEHCRTAALGGHVEACTDCGHWRIAYNSCRNRHCPRCQGAAARSWLEAREADLLPVGYFHVVFTLPAEIAQIAFWNKKAVYDLLFRAAADTMLTIGADPKHLGARVPVPWLESNDTSCILYPSGTTGKPKGVQRDVGGYAVALATSMDTIFGGKAGGVFFCASDIGWVVGHSYIVYAPLLNGSTTIL